MTDKDYTNMNPTELLQEQAQLLDKINHNLEVLTEQQENHTEITTLAVKKILQQLRSPQDTPTVPDTSQLDVTITGISMTILRMANFMVKWAIASIPAAIALIIIGSLVFFTLSGLLSGCMASIG